MQKIYPIIAIIGLVISISSVFKKSPFFNFVGLQILIYGLLKSADYIMPALPAQVILMYMAMSVFSFIIYFSIQEETFKAFLEPMRSLFADDNKKFLRLIIAFIALPLFAGYLTYAKVKPTYDPPVSARIVHPEPPSQMDFKGKTMNVLGLENPLRKDTANFAKNVEEGKKIYYQNCFFCHGDDLDGKGHIADAFNPVPLPFRGTDTIAQLPESFVFWRVAKGWRGLPAGSGPWNSSMPSFEDFLTEEEVWQVIMFIYESTGNKPRSWE
ncbi:c-type cytochrome [Candidatus Magnetominusculus xianensis]|uniref:Cytochrome C n=1 Tax=Candidatus Magnetominusculus xianensis TaxID=1748249 RepID=A0ABR5SB71_9BACT|nr:cytochrome c [Candidatus Magnetominusculus xianensis]KWT76411.1 cytochrome C [Candidatus Magnetominusculus xianensis]MBF0404879.1 cytochrome c [Nitrospirota bacterium]